MSDQNPTGQDPNGKPAIGDTIRAKLEEYEVDRHLHDLASQAEHVVRQGIAKVGELAHDHREDIDRLLDKAASAVDRRTEGRHAEKITQVRGSLERGVERIAEQRPGGTSDGPGSGVPPSNG